MPKRVTMQLRMSKQLVKDATGNIAPTAVERAGIDWERGDTKGRYSYVRSRLRLQERSAVLCYVKRHHQNFTEVFLVSVFLCRSNLYFNYMSNRDKEDYTLRVGVFQQDCYSLSAPMRLCSGNGVYFKQFHDVVFEIILLHHSSSMLIGR